MKQFLKNNYGKLITIIICLFITSFIIFNKSEEKRTTEPRIIKEISIKENDTAYITFYGDEWTYVVYKNNGVDFKIFNELNEDDLVSITFEPTKSKTKYHIIYVMEKDNVELFNVNEYYRLNNIFTKNIFSGLLLSIALTMVIFFIFEKFYKVKNNTSMSFIIKASDSPIFSSSKRMIEFFLFFLIVPLLTSIYSSIVCFLIGLTDGHLLGSIFIPLIFEVIGLFGLFVCLVEKFEFNGKEYSYRHFYLKNEIIALKDIGSVSIIRRKNNFIRCKVTFYDKKGVKRICFNDDGTSFIGEWFVNSLIENKIKIKTDMDYLMPKDPAEVLKFFESNKDKDDKLALICDIVNGKYIELTNLMEKNNLKYIIDYQEDDGKMFYELDIINKENRNKDIYTCMLFYSSEWYLNLYYSEELNASDLSDSEIIELMIIDIKNIK